MANESLDLRFLGAQVQTLQADVRDLKIGYQRLDEAVAGLRADFGRLEARIDAKFEQIDARFDRLEARFERLEGRFTVLEGRFAVLEGRFGGLDDEMRAVNARLDQMSETMATNLSVVLAAIEKKREI